MNQYRITRLTEVLVSANTPEQALAAVDQGLGRTTILTQQVHENISPGPSPIFVRLDKHSRQS